MGFSDFSSTTEILKFRDWSSQCDRHNIYFCAFWRFLTTYIEHNYTNNHKHWWIPVINFFTGEIFTPVCCKHDSIGLWCETNDSSVMQFLRYDVIMPPWYWNAFHITRPLWGESTDLLLRRAFPYHGVKINFPYSNEPICMKCHKLHVQGRCLHKIHVLYLHACLGTLDILTTGYMYMQG